MDITTSSNRTLDIIHQKAGKFSNLLEVFDIPLELESATHYSNPPVNKKDLANAILPWWLFISRLH